MNKNIKITIIVIIIIIVLLGIYFKSKKQEDKEINQNWVEEYLKMKENSMMYNEDATLEELKEEYQITGSNNIYEINTESDGRKVINVKPNINFKVAFCGMIKKSKPTFEELDSIYGQSYPNRNGIWINQASQTRIVEYLNANESLNSEYCIDEEGYLKIRQVNNQTDNDIKIEKLINGDKQYILDISSIYYMVDTVTGEIVDNPYNDFDAYQTYDYCEDENKMIIFISENKENKLTNNEIFNSIIAL